MGVGLSGVVVIQSAGRAESACPLSSAVLSQDGAGLWSLEAEFRDYSRDGDGLAYSLRLDQRMSIGAFIRRCLTHGTREGVFTVQSQRWHVSPPHSVSVQGTLLDHGGLHPFSLEAHQ